MKKIKLSKEVFDLEMENTKLDMVEEYKKILNEDPLVIDLINAAEEKMSDKLMIIINSKEDTFTYVPFGYACKVLKELTFTLRHLIESQINNDDCERHSN